MIEWLILYWYWPVIVAVFLAILFWTPSLLGLFFDIIMMILTKGDYDGGSFSGGDSGGGGSDGDF